MNTLAFRSIDYAGNQEIAQSIQVPIDTSPPEARLAFDPNRRSIVLNAHDAASGLDRFSPIVLSVGLHTYVVGDMAGHTLAVSIDDRRGTGFETISVRSLSTDGDASPPPANVLSVLWSGDSALTRLTQFINVSGQIWSRAIWSDQTDETDIITFRAPRHWQFVRLPGLVSLRLIVGEQGLDFQTQP
jgi:hypothetical protein